MLAIEDDQDVTREVSKLQTQLKEVESTCLVSLSSSRISVLTWGLKELNQAADERAKESEDKINRLEDLRKVSVSVYRNARNSRRKDIEWFTGGSRTSSEPGCHRERSGEKRSFRRDQGMQGQT